MTSYLVPPARAISFEDFLACGGHLIKTDSAFIGRYEYCDEVFWSLPFTADEFEKVDTRLPAVIEAMYAVSTTGKLPFKDMVFTQWIHNTLEMWEHPLALATTDNRTHMVKWIQTLDNYYPGDHEVNIEVSDYSEVYYAGTTPFVIDAGWNILRVRASTLEAFYPGWQVRYAALESLGGDPLEDLDVIFKRPDNLVQVPLTDITFD